MSRPLFPILLCALAAAAAEPSGPPAAPAPTGIEVTDAALEKLKFPGMALNLRERCVDVEAAVCLDEGMLELVACTRESKEHESIVAIDAKPMHIHTALLLLGAKPGNPAMRKPLDENAGRWIDVPPAGDRIDVSLVFADKGGTPAEHPINEFITASEEHANNQENTKFPTHTFLFAGSHLVADGPGPRKYLSGLSGNVISISTFGDELLCLPGVHGHQNGLLVWQVDATKLPAVGTKVTLRLRPRPAPPAETPTTTQDRPATEPAPETPPK